MKRQSLINGSGNPIVFAVMLILSLIASASAKGPDDYALSFGIRVQNNTSSYAEASYKTLKGGRRTINETDKIAPGDHFICQVKNGSTLQVRQNGRIVKKIKSCYANCCGYGNDVTHFVSGGGKTPAQREKENEVKFEMLRSVKSNIREAGNMPSLRVCVYSVRNQKPLRGARIKITDGWADENEAKSDTAYTKANGCVTFRSESFSNWHISHLNQVYQDHKGFEWKALGPDSMRKLPAIFKARITVTLGGYKTCKRAVAFDSPGVETTVYMSGGRIGVL